MPPDRRADDYEISTDLARMDLALVHHWLSTDAYWSLGRSRETVEAAAQGSLNFAAFAGDGSQVGYARVVTDEVTFAWLCDVYVDPAHRGRGLGLRLTEAVVDRLGHVKRIMLITRDAHDVYSRFGFAPTSRPQDLMILEGPGK